MTGYVSSGVLQRCKALFSLFSRNNSCVRSCSACSTRVRSVTSSTTQTAKLLVA